MTDATEMHRIELISKIVYKDQLGEFTEQDKKFLWKNRRTCMLCPNSLNKLLQSFKWSNRENIKEVTCNLKI